MTNAVALRQEQVPTRAGAMTFPEIERLAEGVAKCGLFGMKTKEQALSLMMISQAEGRHPALAARDYDIISNRPAKKAEAMLRDFIESGGKVEWHALDDNIADATFSHMAGGSVRITWDMTRAKAAQLNGKDMYKKYPRQMLRSRCVSEGVRTVYPAATSGMYVPEEVADFDPKPAPSLTPPPAPRQIAGAAPEHDINTGEIGPHPLIVPLEDGKERWTPWGATLIGALKAAKDGDEITAWMKANGSLLERCEAAAPKAYASIIAARDKITDALAVVEVQPLSGSDERALDRAAMAGDAQAIEVDEHADWLEDRIKEAASAKSMPTLDQMDDQVCAELSGADRDELRTRWNAAYGTRRVALTGKK